MEVTQGLRATSGVVLDAVEARNVDALLEAGTELDLACENCHALYWYPRLRRPSAGGAGEPMTFAAEGPAAAGGGPAPASRLSQESSP